MRTASDGSIKGKHFARFRTLIRTVGGTTTTIATSRAPTISATVTALRCVVEAATILSLLVSGARKHNESLAKSSQDE
jgi:hypothetical protein